MESPGVVDDAFRSLFDKAAEKIHKQEDFEEVHETLGEHFNHLENGHSRAVYQVPSQIADCDHPLVVKFALPVIGNSGTEEALYPVEYTEGWMSNMHEIVLSGFDPVADLLVPIVDHHKDGLWTVMPYAETLPDSQEVISKLRPLTERIEKADVEFVSFGETTGQPEIYQIKMGYLPGRVSSTGLRRYCGL